MDMTVPSEAPPKHIEATEALSWGGAQAEIITLRAGKEKPPPQPATSLRAASRRWSRPEARGVSSEARMLRRTETRSTSLALYSSDRRPPGTCRGHNN